MPKSISKANPIRHNICYTRTLEVEMWVGNKKFITTATMGTYHLKWHNRGATAYRDVDQRQCQSLDEVERGLQTVGDYECEWLNEVEIERVTMWVTRWGRKRVTKEHNNVHDGAQWVAT